jgi:alcohol dehydrogenase
MDLSARAFDFKPRTRLVFEAGALARTGEVVRALGASRALVVSDPGVARAGHAGAALASLERAGIAALLFDGAVENPTDACAERGAETAREVRAEAIVGVGGGSAMDCAKAVAILLARGSPIERWQGVGKIGGGLLPLVLAPTTAGTGSEVQSSALITREATGEKMLLWDHGIAPRAAILDPRTTLTAPRRASAAAGIDAVAHAVESHVSARATPLSRMFSREAFRLLLGAFEDALEDSGDLRARSDLLLGASLAGLAIENSMLGAAHSCANPLTHRRGTPHGLAVGLMLPHVIRFNGSDPAVEERYADLLEAAGLRSGPEGASGALAARLEGLLLAADLPVSLREIEVEEDALEDLAAEAGTQWTASFNPRPVGPRDLLEIYRCAL